MRGSPTIQFAASLLISVSLEETGRTGAARSSMPSRLKSPTMKPGRNPPSRMTASPKTRRRTARASSTVGGGNGAAPVRCSAGGLRMESRRASSRGGAEFLQPEHARDRHKDMTSRNTTVDRCIVSPKDFREPDGVISHVRFLPELCLRSVPERQRPGRCQDLTCSQPRGTERRRKTLPQEEGFTPWYLISYS